VCIFTKKVNLKKAAETRFDMYERAMTFEGSEFYSKNGMTSYSLGVE
jgi:hypothetical protein